MNKLHISIIQDDPDTWSFTIYDENNQPVYSGPYEEFEDVIDDLNIYMNVWADKVKVAS